MSKLPSLVVQADVNVIGLKREGESHTLLTLKLTVQDAGNRQERQIEEIAFQIQDAVQLAQDLQRRAIQANQIAEAQKQKDM